MKKKNEVSGKQIAMFFLLLGVVLLFIGTRLYLNGYHTFDSGHNLAWLNADMDENIFDLNSRGILESSDRMIVRGLNNMQNGMNLIFLSTLLIGLMIPMIYHWEKIYGGT